MGSLSDPEVSSSGDKWTFTFLWLLLGCSKSTPNVGLYVAVHEFGSGLLAKDLSDLPLHPLAALQNCYDSGCFIPHKRYQRYHILDSTNMYVYYRIINMWCVCVYVCACLCVENCSYCLFMFVHSPIYLFMCLLAHLYSICRERVCVYIYMTII